MGSYKKMIGNFDVCVCVCMFRYIIYVLLDASLVVASPEAVHVLEEDTSQQVVNDLSSLRFLAR